MGVGDRRFVRRRRGRAPGSQSAGRQGDRHVGLARQTRSAEDAGVGPRFVHARGRFLRRRDESHRRQGRQPGRQRRRRFDVCRVRALDGFRGPTRYRWLCRWRTEKRDRHSSSARQTSDAVRRVEQNAQRGAARCGGAGLCRRSAAGDRRGTRRPVIDKVYPFEQLVAAKAYMESNRHLGKIVLAMPASTSGKEKS